MAKRQYNPYASRQTSKYKAQKVEMDGIVFDSKKERDRYAELKILEKKGEISGLILQPSFVLIPTQYETVERYGKNGRKLKDGRKRIEKQCVYRADFAYLDRNGQKVVEDVKGVKTEVYKIKKKLMLFNLGIKIKEV